MAFPRGMMGNLVCVREETDRNANNGITHGPAKTFLITPTSAREEHSKTNEQTQPLAADDYKEEEANIFDSAVVCQRYRSQRNVKSIDVHFN